MGVKAYEPNPNQTGGRGNTSRFMNPDDFKKKFGYDYTADPNFDSRSDAGGGVVGDPSMVDSSGAMGGGYSQKRIGPQSRGQMDLTKGKGRSILTSVYG